MLLESIINFYFFPITYNHETYVKDTRNQEIFLDKKKINGSTNEDITNFFRLKKGVKGIKDEVLRNIRTFLSMKKKKEIIIKL